MWSIDLTAQVFEQGMQIYHFGRNRSEGKSAFAGWPWHLIPIREPDSAILYFRIYLNYPLLVPRARWCWETKLI